MNRQKQIKVALIDMDGVLYDSMPGHAAAWKQLCDEIGIPCTYDEFFLYEGMTGRDTINLLFKRHFGREVTPKEANDIYKRKAEIFSLQKSKNIMPGVKKMLSKLKQNDVRCILVTGSGQKSILDRIDHDFPDTFSQHDRVTAQDVNHGKPDPEPYLKGLLKTPFSKEEAIVIENAPLGVRAGVAAGIFTIAIMTGPIPLSSLEKERPSAIYPSMPVFADEIDKYL